MPIGSIDLKLWTPNDQTDLPGARGWATNSQTRCPGPGQVQRLDTSFVLAGDGPEPVANGYEITGLLPVSTWIFPGGVYPPNHEAGSGRPVTGEDLR